MDIGNFVHPGRLSYRIASVRLRHRERIRNWKNSLDSGNVSKRGPTIPLCINVPLLAVDINLEEVKQEWLHTTGPHQVMKLAKHFGIFDHLFGQAYFMPLVPLDVKFETGEKDLCHSVCYGNVIKPRFTENAPIVDFESSGQSLWTLVLTNPDGNLYDSNKEVVHWMV